MFRYFFLRSLVFSAFLAVSSLYGQNTLSLLFVGDVMGHGAQIQSAYNAEKNSYEYDDCFTYVGPIFRDNGLTIANLEVTLNCPPYSGYPTFSSDAALPAALIRSGVDVLVTANNHSCDKGKKGVLRTIAALDSLGVMHTGTFESQERRNLLNPLLIEKNGFRLGLLNYTYGTNGIPIPEGTFVNMIDTAVIRQDLARARTMGLDKIIVFIHWGNEYEMDPSSRQTSLADFIFKAGADIIIGSHPHVVQRAEFRELQQQFIVYSLGNFISNQRTTPQDGGMMVRLLLKKENEHVNIKDAAYYLTWVYTPKLEGKKRFFVLPASRYEQDPGFFDNDSTMLTMKKCLDLNRSVLNAQNTGTREMVYDATWQIWK